MKRLSSILIIFAAAGFIFFLFQPLKEKPDPVQIDSSLILLPDFARKIDELPEFIDSLPESYLKNNLQVALAAEYSGDSDELNAILREYARMKLKELKEEQTY